MSVNSNPPMDLLHTNDIHPWHPAQLSTSGRIMLLTNESVIRAQPQVGLYKNALRQPPPFHDGTVSVTSHRLVFVPATPPDLPLPPALCIPLKWILSHSMTSRFLRSSPKISIHVTSATTLDNRISPPLTIPWTCHVCLYPHTSAADTVSRCSQCGNPRQQAFSCPACTFANSTSASHCTLCNTLLLPNSPDPRILPIESPCPSCTLLNPSSNPLCSLCGARMNDLSVMVPDNTSTPDSDSHSICIKLSFRGGGDRGFYTALVSALREQAWNISPTPPAQTKSITIPPQQSTPPVKPIGLSGIVAMQELEQQRQQIALSDAFSDLDALMSKAQEMVSLATNLATKLKPTTADTTSDAAVISEFRSYMLNLGATSALGTELSAFGKRATGEDRDRALAREVSDFLNVVIESQGGIVGMNDLYCMFNRARGVALVSPADLWAATQQFTLLGLPYTARQLESGARIVHTERYADRTLFRDFVSWLQIDRGLSCDKYTGVDPIAISGMLGVSVSLSRQLLDHAVRAGILVVDTPGTRYYANIWSENPFGTSHV